MLFISGTSNHHHISSAMEPDQPSTSTERPKDNAFPLAFRVAADSVPRSKVADEEEFAKRLRQTEQRAKATIKMDQLDLVEELTEPGIPLEVLRSMGSRLSLASYLDTLEERHSMDLCPYPTCSKPATMPYASAPKFRLKGNTIYSAGSQRVHGEPFCSTRCQARSEYFKGFIERGGEGEMLEDIEVRRRTAASAPTVKLSPSPVTATPTLLTIPRPPAATVDPLEHLSRLTIRERVTPSLPPLAPTLAQSAVDFEKPTSTRQSLATAAPTSPGARGSSSMSTTPAKRKSPGHLTPFSPTSGSLLSSSRRPPPPASPTPLPPGTRGELPTFVESPHAPPIDWGMEEEDEDEDVERMIEEGLRARSEMLQQSQSQSL